METNIVPTQSSFWDILDNGLDAIKKGADIYTDVKQKEATTKALTTQTGLEFFKTGIGIISLMIFIILIFYIKK